jgi:hypothetical protein
MRLACVEESISVLIPKQEAAADGGFLSYNRLHALIVMTILNVMFSNIHTYFHVTNENTMQNTENEKKSHSNKLHYMIHKVISEAIKRPRALKQARPNHAIYDFASFHPRLPVPWPGDCAARRGAKHYRVKCISQV